MSADIGIIIGAAVGGVGLVAIGILVYWMFCRGSIISDARITPSNTDGITYQAADKHQTSTPESDKNVSMAVDPMNNEEMTNEY